jgi:radical SAM superfamily enzyme YgiQ (UPF0313 family)
LSAGSLRAGNKRQNMGRDYAEVVRRLDSLGIMINGSFVFGLDDDGPDVFRRTVDWAVRSGLTTSTFHIATPYPGTAYHDQMRGQGRILHENWDLYDTRHVVFRPRGMSAADLESGYRWAYRAFYTWRNIVRASLAHETLEMRVKHGAYAAGWKRFEPMWNLVIKGRRLARLRPVLEEILRRTGARKRAAAEGSSVHLPVLEMGAGSSAERGCARTGSG